MPRNFFRRIECVFPIQDPEIRQRVLGIRETYLSDSMNARRLRSDGSYHPKPRRKEQSCFCAQSFLAQEVEMRKELLRKKRSEEQKNLDEKRPKKKLQP